MQIQSLIAKNSKSIFHLLSKEMKEKQLDKMKKEEKKAKANAVAFVGKLVSMHKIGKTGLKEDLGLYTKELFEKGWLPN